VHQRAAVPVDGHHPALGPPQRDAGGERRGMAHGALHVEVLRPVGQPEQVARDVPGRGDEQRITEQLDQDAQRVGVTAARGG
jgi:hypothetical protein